MAIISKIGQILNTPIGNSAGKTVKNVSNPFAPSSFKGNVLTADVFDVKSNHSVKEKLKLSALVGSIGEAFPTFRKGFESVIAFGNRMKQGLSSAINKINEIGSMEVSIDFGAPVRAIRSGFGSMIDNYSVQKLKKLDVCSLENMWKDLSGLNVSV